MWLTRPGNRTTAGKPGGVDWLMHVSEACLVLWAYTRRQEALLLALPAATVALVLVLGPFLATAYIGTSLLSAKLQGGGQLQQDSLESRLTEGWVPVQGPQLRDRFTSSLSG